MPEQYRRGMMHPYRRAQAYTLRKAHNSSLFVKIICKFCRVTRIFYADDVAQICGDVTIDEVACHFRCEKCRKKEYLDADFINLYGPDIGKTKVMKLVEIRTIRRPVWREEII